MTGGNGSRLHVGHLTASPFYGGPERQMLGLACASSAYLSTTFLCLMEGGKAEPFVKQIEDRGLPAVRLAHNFPNLPATVLEVARRIRSLGCDALCTHGYKADVIGYASARLAGIRVIVVSRGWTGATFKVRMYERLDRVIHRRADRVVCVSEGQARKVRNAGVAERRITTICNAVNTSRFGVADPADGVAVRSLFPRPIGKVVMAVGRLSPEKGFDQFVQAAGMVCRQRSDVGFALIGDGPLSAALRAQIGALGLSDRIVLAGFREDVDQLLPYAACLVQSSHTEGMPNVVLEAMAASIPVVATAVGGTPELVADGVTGWLVPPADPRAIADRVLDVLAAKPSISPMGTAARRRVEQHFSFAAQASAYERLLSDLVRPQVTVPYSPVAMARA